MDMTKVLSISIHALLTESDWLLGTEFQTLPLISIHALLTESDVKKKTYRSSVFVFQSTLSLRRATKAGGTGLADLGISIHALLAESDQRGLQGRLLSLYFNPRSPCGERRGIPCHVCLHVGISIHALLAESDIIARRREMRAHEISIHALLAESDILRTKREGGDGIFQSTLSLRRATRIIILRCSVYGISIHALLAESDQNNHIEMLCLRNFNPRSPCGERPVLCLFLGEPLIFQSTLSLRRATGCHVLSSFRKFYFNPRSPCGERRLRR